MDLPHIVALSIFSSYFIAILSLFVLILRTIYSSKLSSKSAFSGKALLFTILTLQSFAHTWFYMFKYMAWSFANYESLHPSSTSQDLLHRVASWLHDTSLFEQAWFAVCAHPLNWWWSEQLCTFTVGAWTVFIAVEGHRHKIKHTWAYMLLGQIVAISVASNLFYIALILSHRAASGKEQTTSQTAASPRLWLSVLLSFATIAISPYTSTQTFLPNLLVMHALLFAPLIGISTIVHPTKSFSVDTKTLYRLIQILAAAIHLRTVFAAARALKQDSISSSTASRLISVAWDVLHSHPAQSSIGWDVVWTSISFIFWMLTSSEYPSALSKLYSVLYLTLATPISSVGVSAPYILRSLRAPDATIQDKRE
ncbi:hypothetical protein CPC08DRAFT_659183 [Agrocybe pediades]|nr:hypothetical protein CPC08DRAFT_659183 [Agrocybe pediades]